jgi:hypothetical protein
VLPSLVSSPHRVQRINQGKDTQVSSFTRISYGAQELAVFLLVKFTFDLYVFPISESKQAFAFANDNNWREQGEEVNENAISYQYR